MGGAATPEKVEGGGGEGVLLDAIGAAIEELQIGDGDRGVAE